MQMGNEHTDAGSGNGSSDDVGWKVGAGADPFEAHRAGQDGTDGERDP